MHEASEKVNMDKQSCISLDACMHVCMHVCIYSTCVYIKIHTHACDHSEHLYVWSEVGKGTFSYTESVLIHANIFVCVCVYIYIYIYTHTYIHTYIHSLRQTYKENAYSLTRACRPRYDAQWKENRRATCTHT